MKVLIISHNPITTYQNMGKTFLTLFSSFEQNELCQLYIYPTLPDVKVCCSYFRITDRDVLKSYGRFGKVDSKIITTDQIDTESHSLFDNDKDANFYRKNKKNSLSLFLRDCMWFFAKWYSPSMKNWLTEQQPTCIFFAPGKSTFIYDIALRISNDLHIPIVTYICDDYYFVKKPKSLAGRLQNYLLKKSIEKLMLHSSHLITICDELKECYSKRFCIEATTIMTGSSYPIAGEPHITEKPTIITYLGNIRCNRFNSLADIGRALDEINEENNTSYELHIYSGEKDRSILSHFDGIQSIRFCGFVSGEEFDKVFHSAQILLHTEAFDEESIDLVKHSVSTKIADSLGSGIPLLAYGPKNVASMQHLIRNKCAVVITDRGELKEQLVKIFTLSQILYDQVPIGLQIADKYHDTLNNSAKLYNTIFAFMEN